MEEPARGEEADEEAGLEEEEAGLEEEEEEEGGNDYEENEWPKQGTVRNTLKCFETPHKNGTADMTNGEDDDGDGEETDAKDDDDFDEEQGGGGSVTGGKYGVVKYLKRQRTYKEHKGNNHFLFCGFWNTILGPGLRGICITAALIALPSGVALGLVGARLVDISAAFVAVLAVWTVITLGCFALTAITYVS